MLKSLRKSTWHLLPFDLDVKRECREEKTKFKKTILSDDTCLEETAAWLRRAQDSSDDCGVSRAFKAAKHRGYGPVGWQPSYPETTGYIIPTFFALADKLKNDDYFSRAFKMADWEIEIQMENGAVMGSVVTAPPSPAVFNTGQVIFGWLESYRRNGEKKYLDAARKAGDFLVSVQEEDGSWEKGDSRYARKGATTYNTRVAWALTLLGIETNSGAYTDAGKRTVELALNNQQSNGWFPDNCLNDPDRPLLHTIVYATRGILETGILLNEDKYIIAAQRTLDALLSCQRPDGGISGRLDKKWKPTVQWDCITGDAQVAIAWLRAASLTKNARYEQAARKIVDFIKRTQNIEHPNPGIRGGVKGSYPFDGEYGQFEMLNWAAKFFCDAIMMINDSDLAHTGING